jgi:hypothetical protein
MSRQEQWFTLLAEQEQSFLTVKAFCVFKNIKLSTFQYWRKRYKQASSAKGFIPIVGPVSGNAAIRLSYPNGINVYLDGADLSLIAQLIRLA